MLEAAESTIAKLTDKRSAIAKRVAEIDRERSTHSYAAYAEEDKAAQKALAALSVEAVNLDQTAASLDAALTTARLKLEAAQAAERTAETRKAAKQARANYKRFGDNGSKIAEHLMAASMLIEDTKRLNDDKSCARLSASKLAAFPGQPGARYLHLDHDAAAAPWL